jgi:hypothetical protein
MKKNLGRPIRNNVTISDKKAIEWFLQKVSTPVTTERRESVLKRVNSVADMFTV